MKTNYIKCGDCMELMKKEIDDKSIDIILTSPPYNIGRKSNSKVSRGSSSYYYDEYVDNRTNEEYVEWSVNVFNEFNRILKKDGVVLYNFSYATNSIATCSLLWQLAASIIEKTDFMIADCITWKKKSSIPNTMSKNKLTRIFEFIFVICRKKDFKTFNANKQITSYRSNGQANYENVYNFIEAPNNDGACELNHCTFSTELVNKLLKMYSYSEDNIILDPFMGTGTTIIGCIQNNRKYIGYEISQRQVDYATERITKEFINKK